MKTLDLAQSNPALEDVLDLAGQSNVLLRTLEGRTFLVVELDDFDEEVELVRQNGELRALLKERSKETERYTLQQVRELLELD